MRTLLSFLLIMTLSLQSVTIFADSSDNNMISVHIEGYNDIATQYNEASVDRTAWRKRVLLNLQIYVNHVISRSDRILLKKKGYILRTSPINGTIPLLNTGGLSPVVPSTSNKTTPQVIKSGNLTIKESSFQKISESNDFKIYESEVRATDGDTTLERIDFVQFGTGEGINIGELYKLDYGNTIFKLTTSKDERIYKYYKRDGNPGISFDLFTGMTPGMKIEKGETVKFTVKIDTNSLSNFTTGKDFQRTNIFFVKYTTKGKEGYYDHSVSRGVFYNNAEESYEITGSTPQIIVYNVCDESVKAGSGSNLIVFDEYQKKNIFQKIKLGKYPDYSEFENPILSEVDYRSYNDKGVYTQFGYFNDYLAYQIEIHDKIYPTKTTFTDWLKENYLKQLLLSYKDNRIPWLFFGYESKFTQQFKPINGMMCKDIKEIAKKERIEFKDTYDEIKKIQEKKNYSDTMSALNQKISDLQSQVKVLQTNSN